MKQKQWIEATPEEGWTDTMREIASFARDVWQKIGRGARASRPLRVAWYDDRSLGMAVAFRGTRLLLNRCLLGRAIGGWRRGDPRALLALLIHEFAHARSGDHLSEDYHGELCRIGADLAVLCDVARMIERAETTGFAR